MVSRERIRTQSFNRCQKRSSASTIHFVATSFLARFYTQHTSRSNPLLLENYDYVQRCEHLSRDPPEPVPGAASWPGHPPSHPSPRASKLYRKPKRIRRPRFMRDGSLIARLFTKHPPRPPLPHIRPALQQITTISSPNRYPTALHPPAASLLTSAPCVANSSNCRPRPTRTCIRPS